ncbi:MAG: radical SAM/SPASM domain-containing protein [Myxococcota bacterium]
MRASEPTLPEPEDRIVATEPPSSLSDLPSPEPACGIESYLEERENALRLSARCHQNYARYQASKRRSATVDYLPIKLDIENVSRCNFRCSMCVVSDWVRGQRAKDMSWEDFKRILDEQHGLLEIKLQGIGEPLLQGDEFFRMIRYARARHIWVRTTTNASLLHLRENYKKLIDSGVNEVQISIDGATREVFEEIRGGSRFDRVRENCKLINGYCDTLGRWPTKMWTVVQRGNAQQLSALVDLAAELGFRSQVFSLNLSDWGLKKWEERNRDEVVLDALDLETLWGLVDRGRARGIRVAFWTVNQKYSTAAPDLLCPWPFERAYVSSDLRVVPCCYLGNPDVYEIRETSDANSGTVGTWLGPEYTAFRAAHLRGEVPEVCRGCYRSEARDPRDD